MLQGFYALWPLFLFHVLGLTPGVVAKRWRHANLHAFPFGLGYAFGFDEPSHVQSAVPRASNMPIPNAQPGALRAVLTRIGRRTIGARNSRNHARDAEWSDES